tara:strand:+ start:175 stop:765 length:591 start_codon:yes stop_codon:yes gene_type:complete
MLNNKAAMFGLDARIALAIFGALSVISGAALYSAIQDAKATAMYQEIVELEKAIESLYLDLGYVPISSSTNAFDARYLHTNPGNLSNWSGPYFPGDPKYNNDSFVAIGSYIYQITPRSNPLSCGSHTSDANGNVHIYMSHLKEGMGLQTCHSNLQLVQAVHDKFDTDGDYTDGKLRVYSLSADRASLVYRIPKALL